MGDVPSEHSRPPAASLYRGVVMHARLKPVGHRFTYRVASLAIDLDRLADADAQSALFSVNRRNLFAFREADHGPGDGTALRPWIDALLRDARVDLRSPGRIILLCYPRILGYVFNPLSVYYCYDDADHLTALVYEVRNTFGERHAYVAPVRAGEASEAGIRQECQKLFHVSPFLGMGLRYRFRLRPPDETVAVRILECDDDGPILAATFSGRRVSLGTAALLRTFGAIPLQSLKIIAGIRWEALKLWLKGARYHARPIAPAHASVDGRMIGER